MGMRKITIWSLGIVTLVLLIWDVLAYFFGENATISVVVTDWAYYTPWFPLAVGVLIGHWFFPAKRSIDK